MNAAEKLKKLKELTGATQADLALIFNVEKNTVARWLRGEREISLAYISAIDEYYEAEVNPPDQDGNFRGGWSQFDDRRLHRLAVDLAKLEFPNSQIVFSNPFSGADGGWDGGAQDGSVLVQAKFSDQPRKDAFPILKTNLEKELKNAEKFEGLKHYVLVTSINLTLPQVHILHALAGDCKFVVEIWNAFEVEERCKKFGWLLFKYFRIAQAPRLIPSFEYLENFENDLPLTAFENAGHVVTDLLEGDKSVYLIHGPSRSGKSRFARECLRRLAASNSRWSAWVATDSSVQTCKEALQTGLAFRDNKNVIVLDDAHRCEADCRFLVDVASQFPNNLKIILVSSDSGVPLVDSVTKHREVQLRKLKVPVLTPEQLAHIFLTASNGVTFDKPGRVVRELDGDLFLLTELGKRLAQSQQAIPIKELLENIRFEENASIQHLLGLEPDKVDRLITELALVLPIGKVPDSSQADKIHSKIAERAQLSWEDYAYAIRRLIDGNIILATGSRIAFRSKWSSYVFLNEKIRRDGSRFCEPALERWIEFAPKNVLSNLAIADAGFGGQTVKETISGLVTTWIGQSSQTSPSRRKFRLRALSSVSSLIPTHILALVHRYAQCPSEIRDEELAQWGIEEREPDMGEYAPLLKSVGSQKDYAVKTLSLIQDLERKKVHNYFSNHSTKALVESIVEAHLLDAGTTLTILKAQLAKSLEQFCISFEVIMALTVEVSDSFEGTITLGTRYIPRTDDVLCIRKFALQAALEKCVNASTPLSLRVMLIGLMQNIGNNRGGFPIQGVAPLSRAVIRERKLILEHLRKWISSEFKPSEFEFLTALQNLLEDWWSRKKVADTSIVPLLLNFPSSLLYLTYRAFLSPHTLVFDYSKLLAECRGDRFRWLFTNASTWNADEDFYLPLTSQIKSTFPTVAEVFEFLSELTSCLPSHLSRAPDFIGILLDSNAASDLIRIPGFDSLHESIKSSTRKLLAVGNQSFLADWLSKLENDSNESSEDTFRFYFALKDSEESLETKKNYLIRMIRSANAQLRKEAAWRAWVILKGKPDYLQEILFQMLTGEYSFNEEDIGTNARHLQDAGLSISDSVRALLIQKVTNASRLEYEHEQILRLVSLSFSELLAFLRTRLSKEINAEADYEGIPFHGIGFLTDLVVSQADAEEIYSLCNEMYQQDPIHLQYPTQYLLKDLHYREFDGRHCGLVVLEKFLESAASNYTPEVHERIWWQLSFLKINSINQHLFIQALELADNNNKLDDIKSEVWSALRPSTWSNSIGQIPAHLTAAKQYLSSLNDKTNNPSLNHLFDSLQESVEKEIKWSLERDQDFINEH